MTIIQNESRFENIRKVNEMRDFFEWDIELRITMLKMRQIKRCLFLSELLMLFLIGVLLFLFITGKLKGLPFPDRLKFVILYSLSASVLVWFLHQYWRIHKSPLLKRYTSQDMFLYFLLSDGFVESIQLSRNRKMAILFKEHGSNQISIKGYTLEGSGREVQKVDLDRHILYLAE